MFVIFFVCFWHFCNVEYKHCGLSHILYILVCLGGVARALTWPDEWTATTVDGKRSAQFEHTLLVTPDGVEALTGKIETSPLQFWERDSKVHTGFWLGNTKAARARAQELTEKAMASSPSE